MKYENRLFELRGDLSQAEFAKLIGLSQQNYGNYEKGKQALRSDLIKRICTKFGCSAEWLLGFDAPIPPTFSKQEQTLLRDFRSCTPDRRLMLLRTAHDYAAASGEMAQKDTGEVQSAKRRVV